MQNLKQLHSVLEKKQSYFIVVITTGFASFFSMLNQVLKYSKRTNKACFYFDESRKKLELTSGQFGNLRLKWFTIIFSAPACTINYLPTET